MPPKTGTKEPATIPTLEDLQALQEPYFPQDFIHILQDYGYTKLHNLLIEEIGGEKGQMTARLLDHLSMCYAWEAMIVHNQGKLPACQNDEMLVSLPEMLHLLAKLGASWHGPSSWLAGI